MIWLTWRQFRTPAIAAATALALIGGFLLWLGADLRSFYDAAVTGCTTECTDAAYRTLLTNEYGTKILLAGLLVMAAPGFVGALWGAPLIAREIETGTHRLAWTQSVTRRRWLTAKTAVVGGAALVFTAALAGLLTWAAAPYDDLVDDRFTALVFSARNLAPLGYAVLAFAIGLTAGLLARRTLVAVTATMIAFLAVQLAAATLLRPHYQEPVTEDMTLAEAEAAGDIDSFNVGEDGATLQGLRLPGAWVVSDYMDVTDASGDPITSDTIADCDPGGPPGECMSQFGAHFDVTYHPADRYWTFQWIELAGALALAAVLLALAYWRLPRGVN
ncbi:transporter [Glycomyces endophyticus]|uniref:Transporter n=1 Tax=Glycomyces endophyticus TaxID=480996 RepID=A0ABP4TSE2_9ACTN